jgi:penicillin-binding protein 2
MIDPVRQVRDRTAPVSPQMALRVAALGVGALVMFAIIFFRLWYLEVLSGDKYRQEANNNKVRLIREQAPRGAIVDRNNRTLVENRQATVVQLRPTSLPDEERAAANRWGQAVGLRLRRPKGHRGHPIPLPPVPYVAGQDLQARFARLGKVVGLSAHSIQAQVIQQLAITPYAPVTIRTDVPRPVRDYIKERQEQFAGVDVKRVFLRKYPYRQLAAQIVGNIGQVSPKELKGDKYRHVPAGTTVGQDGLEYSYDRYLRGRDGLTRIVVDASGNPTRTDLQRAPEPGRQLQLSLDLGLQRSAQDAMARAGHGLPGAFVAMDPTNGEVLALGSYPSFDPSILSHPITQATYERLFGKDAGSPAYDRAIAGYYPTGSTFKPITALAALTNGVITPDTPINDSGCIAIGLADQQFCNAGKVANGTLSLTRAIQVSSDVFFYTLGRDLNGLAHQPLQTWAHALGLGRKTGIDLPGEINGLIPDRAWRTHINNVERACEKRKHVPSCFISDKRDWTVGDNVNLAVGQGDLQATPLQMATVYSTIVNGGRVPKPHLGLRVQDNTGRLVQQLNPGASRHVDINPTYRQAIMDGLRLAAGAPGGTSYDVWQGWNQSRFPIYGKTGTAQRNGQQDQSWYVCYSYDGSPTHRPIVIAVTVEKGGFGAEAAAPAARLMMSKWFGQKAKFVAGSSHTL